MVVGNDVCLHGAFAYAEPEPGMEKLADRIAFWPMKGSPLNVA